LAEIAFDAALLLDHPADLAHVVLGQILDADVRRDTSVLQDAVRAHTPDAVDVGETDLDPLGARKINACDSCHLFSPVDLTLSLLVLLVRANDPHDAPAPHDLALVANPSHRCPDLHRSVPVSTRRPQRAKNRFSSSRSSRALRSLQPLDDPPSPDV